MNNFKEIDLPVKLHNVLGSMGFSIPTPIQAKAIPILLEGRDLLGCAQTGTGKTVAFCVPLISHLLRNEPGGSALVLAPTRELAFQIADVLKQMTAPFPRLSLSLIVGGASMYKQIQSLSRKPSIIVGTPGRIIDHLNKKNLKVTTTKIVVLDEADRMLDMGFEPQLREIFKYLPQLRQTLLFSATFPQHIEALAQKYLKNPVHVSVGEAHKPVMEVRQSAIQTTESDKNKTLLNELSTREGSILIFTRTKRRTDRLSRLLKDKKHTVGRIHGGLSQGQRNLAMEQFRNNKNRILVATDLAARGLDIDHIRHVINYDLPAVPEDYVHRIGRTARAGAHGEALSLLVPEDYDIWKKISDLYKIKGPTLPQPQRSDSFRQGFQRRRSRRHKRH
ncbi:MAG: DEAD/DEAH box helicase [Deltaproteobacteria bacterium]|nr:DEAD/DEAH box helicase [Deltaproteobacteria bacterium]